MRAQAVLGFSPLMLVQVVLGRGQAAAALAMVRSLSPCTLTGSATSCLPQERKRAALDPYTTSLSLHAHSPLVPLVFRRNVAIVTRSKPGYNKLASRTRGLPGLHLQACEKWKGCEILQIPSPRKSNSHRHRLALSSPCSPSSIPPNNAGKVTRRRCHLCSDRLPQEWAISHLALQSQVEGRPSRVPPAALAGMAEGSETRSTSPRLQPESRPTRAALLLSWKC
uniref:Putative secreted protein n=1 Tax=Ixodes ricinus TaxID=34613 RepID=A0A6B0V321_IXORI